MIKEYFEVYYDGEFGTELVKVYYIDPIRDRFLVANDDKGYFMWVNTKDCILKKDDND